MSDHLYMIDFLWAVTKESIISSLNGKFNFYVSTLHRNSNIHHFSSLKPALSREISSFKGTIKTFYDIVILMPNIHDQSLCKWSK